MNAGTNRYLPLLLGVGWLIVLSHPATVLADIHSNLQVRYRLDEMSGSAADSSGNGNTGTLNNGANFTANGRFGAYFPQVSTSIWWISSFFSRLSGHSGLDFHGAVAESGAESGSSL